MRLIDSNAHSWMDYMKSLLQVVCSLGHVTSVCLHVFLFRAGCVEMMPCVCNQATTHGRSVRAWERWNGKTETSWTTACRIEMERRIPSLLRVFGSGLRFTLRPRSGDLLKKYLIAGVSGFASQACTPSHEAAVTFKYLKEINFKKWLSSSIRSDGGATFQACSHVILIWSS